MSIRRLINRHTVCASIPIVLTALSIGGVVATAIVSARAGVKYKERIDDGEEPLKAAAKEAIVPTITAGATIGAFIFCGKSYKALVTGTSVAAASLANNRITPFNTKRQDDPDTFVIDQDGDLYYEPLTDSFIRMTGESYEAGMLKFNKNYNMRGICSLYEMYRMFGVTKADIKRANLDWIKYVGWHVTPMYEGKGFAWIDSYVYNADETQKYKVIAIEDQMLPICSDAPEWLLDICHVDKEDVREYEFELPYAKDITQEIAYEIQDKDAP